MRLKEALAQNLKRFRAENSLTQHAMAKILGVHQPYLARLESGIAPCTLDSLESIGKALKIQPIQLIDTLSILEPKEPV